MMSDFHPDKNLPGCMMPDGGECCKGHAAVVDDWHKQRQEIESLREDLSKASDIITQFQIEATHAQLTAEPVAWRYRPIGTTFFKYHEHANKPLDLDDDWEVEPLYTTPQPVAPPATNLLNSRGAQGAQSDAVSLSDPHIILAGIKQFGLAADGSDLRDLAAAINRLKSPQSDAVGLNILSEAIDALEASASIPINDPRVPEIIAHNKRMAELAESLRSALFSALRPPAQSEAVREALPSVDEIASAVHDGRYREGRNEIGWTPFEQQDENGKQYCRRIARSVLAALSAPRPAATPVSDHSGFGLQEGSGS